MTYNTYIHFFRALAPRLDEADFRTMMDNPKYKALKHENTNKTDTMLVLTPTGVNYLKEQWGINVNKNGEKRKRGETLTERDKILQSSSLSVKNGDLQKFNNRILDLVDLYFTIPEK